MCDLTETFKDSGFAEGQIVASHYLTNRILTFSVAAVGTYSPETFDEAAWKAAYPQIEEGDVVLSLRFTNEDRLMHVAPKYHQVVPFPSAIAA